MRYLTVPEPHLEHRRGFPAAPLLLPGGTTFQSQPRRRVTTPLLFILLLVGVLAASSLFFGRPTDAPAPRTSLPQVSPSALPALPPAPTHDLRVGSA